MITKKNEQHYLAMFETWNNGNKKDAAKKVKRLTKKQLVELLVRSHEYAGSYLIGNQPLRFGWEDFIELALNRIYD